MQMYSEITENSFKFTFLDWISESKLTQSDRIPLRTQQKINA